MFSFFLILRTVLIRILRRYGDNDPLSPSFIYNSNQILIYPKGKQWQGFLNEDHNQNVQNVYYNVHVSATA